MKEPKERDLFVAALTKALPDHSVYAIASAADRMIRAANMLQRAAEGECNWSPEAVGLPPASEDGESGGWADLHRKGEGELYVAAVSVGLRCEAHGDPRGAVARLILPDGREIAVPAKGWTPAQYRRMEAAHDRWLRRIA